MDGGREQREQRHTEQRVHGPMERSLRKRETSPGTVEEEMVSHYRQRAQNTSATSQHTNGGKQVHQQGEKQRSEYILLHVVVIRVNAVTEQIAFLAYARPSMQASQWARSHQGRAAA